MVASRQSSCPPPLRPRGRESPPPSSARLSCILLYYRDQLLRIFSILIISPSAYLPFLSFCNRNQPKIVGHFPPLPKALDDGREFGCFGTLSKALRFHKFRKGTDPGGVKVALRLETRQPCLGLSCPPSLCHSPSAASTENFFLAVKSPEKFWPFSKGFFPFPFCTPPKPDPPRFLDQRGGKVEGGGGTNTNINTNSHTPGPSWDHFFKLLPQKIPKYRQTSAPMPSLVQHSMHNLPF